MKKLLSAIAFAAVFAVSCNKEVETITSTPSEQGNVVTIKASLDDLSKTAYSNGKTFSWISNDVIRVLTSDGNGYSFANFSAESSGASTTFSATLTDWYRPTGLAFYPTSKITPSFDGSNYTVKLSANFTVPSDADSLSTVPLIGAPNQAGDAYNFSTATGILKFTVNNVPDDAYWFTIYTNQTGQSLCGTFTVDDSKVISLDNHTGDAETMYYGVIKTDANGTYAAYVPVPVGTIRAGAVIALETDSDQLVYEVQTVKDIEVVRNQVIEIAPINVPELWDYVGTGQYNDYCFLGDYDDYIDVDIYQGKLNPNKYKIVDPYSQIHTLLGSTPITGMIGPEDLIIEILNNGDNINGSYNADDDGFVIWEAYYTGFDDYGDEVQMLHPLTPYLWSGVTLDDARLSRVLEYDALGNPAVIQLAPTYLDYYSAGSSWYKYYDGICNQTVQIIFPNQEPLDGSFDYTAGQFTDNSPEHPVYTFNVSRIGTYADNLKVAYSTVSAVDAISNIDNGQVAVAGDVNISLPANLSSGDVFIALASFKNGEVWLSSSFTVEWTNSNENLGYVLDDLVGTYDIDGWLYRGSSWTQGTLVVVIEESDDTAKGNFVITSIDGTQYGGITRDLDGIYGTFNTATGRITIPPAQFLGLLYDYYAVSIGYYGDQSSDVVFDLTTPGEFVLHDQSQMLSIDAYVNGSYYTWLDVMDYDLVATRTSTGISKTSHKASVSSTGTIKPVSAKRVNSRKGCEASLVIKEKPSAKISFSRRAE